MMWNRTFLTFMTGWMAMSAIPYAGAAQKPLFWSELLNRIRKDILREPIEPQIRVRMLQSTPGFKLTGHHLVLRTENVDMGQDARMDSIEIQCSSSGQAPIRIEIRRSGVTFPVALSGPVDVEANDLAGLIELDGAPFRQKIRIYPTDTGCDVVNILDLEKYLVGLVNAEFSSQWSEEAIAAQVVAARTYALFRIQEASLEVGRTFDVESTVKDQVYPGAKLEDSVAAQVVERTRGWILSGKQTGVVSPISAFYHSTCGGMTQSSRNVWGTGRASAGTRRPVRCLYCASSPQYRWEIELSSHEVENAFLKILGEGRFSEGAFSGVRILERDSAGRILRLAGLRWIRGKIREFPVAAAQWREVLGSQRLKSTYFDLRPIQKAEQSGWSYHLTGKGYGHGVGMCQWGAKTMGEKGFSMATILKHYYPDAILTRIR